MSDPRSIIPKAVPPHHERVTDWSFRVRTMADYDMNFLQDRLRSEVFINDQPVGVYSVMCLPDEVSTDLAAALHFFGPKLERNVIDEFMGLGYRRRVGELERELRELKAFVNRDHWWQFRPLRRLVRHEVTTLRARLAAAIGPRDE